MTFVALCFPQAMTVTTPWVQVPLVGVLMCLLAREIARTRVYSLEIWDRLFSNSASIQSLPDPSKIRDLEEKQPEPLVAAIEKSDWQTDLIIAAEERAARKQKQPEVSIDSRIKRDWRRDLITVAKKAS